MSEPSDFDVDLALELSSHVHANCSAVNHDIGIELAQIVARRYPVTPRVIKLKIPPQEVWANAGMTYDTPPCVHHAPRGMRIDSVIYDDVMDLPPPIPEARPWWYRAYRTCLYLFTQHRWARRLYGGKWEEWWADACTSYVWLHREEWTPPGKRPGGCEIGKPHPAPLAREDWG